MKLPFLPVLLLLASLTGGYASKNIQKRKSKFRLKGTKKLVKSLTSEANPFPRNKTILLSTPKDDMDSYKSIKTHAVDGTEVWLKSKAMQAKRNETVTSNKRQNVVSFTGDPSQQRLFHLDETGTLHRHEVGPEEFSTPEGKTETFSNEKGLSQSSLSNLRPSQGSVTEASRLRVLEPYGVYKGSPLQSYSPYSEPPSISFHPVAFASPPISSEQYPPPLPTIHNMGYAVPFPRIQHIPYAVPVHKIHRIPYPVMVPIRQPPMVKPVPVPVPYPVATPPRIQNIPYPVAVPIRSPPQIRIQKVPVPVPVPQPLPVPRAMPIARSSSPMSRAFFLPRPILPMPVGLSECSTNPCRNGGTCYSVEETYKCHCATGFKGRHCEDTSKCHPNPCENFGECTVLQDGYECSCKKGFRGSRCEVRDQCHPSPCRNGGSCTSVSNEYSCSCIYGFIGKNCEVESKCFPLNPCKHGGTCHEDDTDYKCTCMPGWDGISCEIPDPCSRNPCYHGGVCSALGTTYKCSCPTGYLGRTCQIESQCHSSNPCQNGGTCREHGFEGYKCYCNSRWGGDNCETPADLSYSGI